MRFPPCPSEKALRSSAKARRAAACCSASARRQALAAVGRGSSPRRLARSRRGSSPQPGAAGPGRPLGRLPLLILVCTRVGSPRGRSGSPRGIGRGGVGARLRRDPAAGGASLRCASSAGTSQSRCGGSVTIATVPLLGSGRAASRTPIECLRATRCTTGNPVCRPVRSSTSGTGPGQRGVQRRDLVRARCRCRCPRSRNMTPPSSSRCPLTVTVPGEYLVALSSSAAITDPTSSAA